MTMESATDTQQGGDAPVSETESQQIAQAQIATLAQVSPGRRAPPCWLYWISGRGEGGLSAGQPWKLSKVQKQGSVGRHCR